MMPGFAGGWNQGVLVFPENSLVAYDIIVVIFMVKTHLGGLYNIDITNTPLADQYAHPLADPLSDFS